MGTAQSCSTDRHKSPNRMIVALLPVEIRERLVESDGRTADAKWLLVDCSIRKGVPALLLPETPPHRRHLVREVCRVVSDVPIEVHGERMRADAFCAVMHSLNVVFPMKWCPSKKRAWMYVSADSKTTGGRSTIETVVSQLAVCVLASGEPGGDEITTAICIDKNGNEIFAVLSTCAARA